MKEILEESMPYGFVANECNNFLPSQWAMLVMIVSCLLYSISY